MLRGLSVGDRATIRDAGLFDWIDAAPYLALVRALETGLGGERARAFWQDHLREAFGRPLIKPLRVSAYALHGRSPWSLVRNAARAWSLVSRDCGAPRASSPADGEALVEFTDLPRVIRATPEMLGVWAGNLRACIADAGRVGRVEERPDWTSGRVALRLTWR